MIEKDQIEEIRGSCSACLYGLAWKAGNPGSSDQDGWIFENWTDEEFRDPFQKGYQSGFYEALESIGRILEPEMTEEAAAEYGRMLELYWKNAWPAGEFRAQDGPGRAPDRSSPGNRW